MGANPYRPLGCRAAATWGHECSSRAHLSCSVDATRVKARTSWHRQTGASQDPTPPRLPRYVIGKGRRNLRETLTGPEERSRPRRSGGPPRRRRGNHRLDTYTPQSPCARRRPAGRNLSRTYISEVRVYVCIFFFLATHVMIVSFWNGRRRGT